MFLAQVLYLAQPLESRALPSAVGLDARAERSASSTTRFMS